jgi:Zn-finger nucleic acid-binding protein
MKTCENCGAPLRPDLDRGLYICDYCGSELVPPEGDDGVLVLDPAAFPCPLCARKLNIASLAEIAILYCAPCRGMLIAMTDMEAIVAGMRAHRDRPAGYVAPRRSADEHRAIACPRCGVTMDDHPYGGGGNVNVDSCEACGCLWLDRGELRKIASAPDYQPVYLEYGDPRER